MMCDMFNMFGNGMLRCNVLNDLKAEDVLLYIYSPLQPRMHRAPVIT